MRCIRSWKKCEEPHHDHLLQHTRPCRTDLSGALEGQRTQLADRDPPRQPRPRGAAARRNRDGRRTAARARLRPRASKSGSSWGDVDLRDPDGGAQGIVSRLLQRPRPREPPARRGKPRADRAGQLFRIFSKPALHSTPSRRASATPTASRPGALDVLAQHVMALACAAPFDEAELLAGDPQRGAISLDRRGNLRAAARLRARRRLRAQKSYDRFRRLAPTDRDAGGSRISASPRSTGSTPGSSSRRRWPTYASGTGGGPARSRNISASTPTPGDTFCCRAWPRGRGDPRHRPDRPRDDAPLPDPEHMGARLAISTRLADWVRPSSRIRRAGSAFRRMCASGSEMQALRSALPRPGELLVETFLHEGNHYLVCYPFEGWNAHQSLGMLITEKDGTRRAAAHGFRRPLRTTRSRSGRCVLWCTRRICSMPRSCPRNSSNGSNGRTSANAPSARSRLSAKGSSSASIRANARRASR